METATTAESTLPGLNILVQGGAGAGKTWSIGTICDFDPNLEVFYLGLEPGLETLFAYWKDRGREIPPNLHWHLQAAPKASFKELLDSAKMINTMSLKALAEMVDPNRQKHNQYLELLSTLNDFPDDRTGKKFGSVDSWGVNRVLAIDGLTGLGRAAMSLVVGAKPVKSQSDWGIAQDTLEKLLRNLCDSCACHFILISHIEREVDPVLGGTKVTVSTLGRALAPKIPIMFSDVIWAKRASNDKWVWDTADTSADLKTRNLSFAGNHPQDFGPIFKKWLSRGGVVK